MEKVKPWLGEPQNTIAVLQKYGFVFQKKYGQNFLIDTHVLERIIEASEITKDDFVLEIGPGIGTMTQYLCEAARQVLAVEIDNNLIPILQETLSPYDNVEILHGDILKQDIHEIAEKYNDKKPIKVVANLPYYITTPIIMGLLESHVPLANITVMVQKEVAERIAAGPGSKTYGILSVLIQAWYRVEYLFTVSEHVFNPPPKVKSAVIRMTRNDTQQLGCDEKLFKQVVKTTFNQRRKTLRNSIKPILGKECPLTEDPLFNKRPEQLSVQEFIELTNQVETALKETIEK